MSAISWQEQVNIQWDDDDDDDDDDEVRFVHYIQKLMVLSSYIFIIFKLDLDHMTAVSSLMDRILDLSNNSIQYGNSMCPSMIRKLKFFVCENTNSFVVFFQI